MSKGYCRKVYANSKLLKEVSFSVFCGKNCEIFVINRKSTAHNNTHVYRMFALNRWDEPGINCGLPHWAAGRREIYAELVTVELCYSLRYI